MDKARILVVEDEGIIAMTLRNRLLELNYDVPATVFSGEEALVKADELQPDLVLMDIRLRGGMDGIETADKIRAKCDIPVVYLTAYADEETLARAKVTEPYGYVLKPYQERELHTAIQIALYRHQVERRLREAEARLRQAEKLEAVGLLAAGMAHHFNNLMAIVAGYTSLLLDGQGEQEESRRHLQTILAASERAAGLTRQLLAFSRKYMLRPAVYDLHQVVASLRGMLQRRLGPEVTLVIEVGAKPATAEFDLTQIEQVLISMADNSRQAMPRGGQFTIRVETMTVDEEACRTVVDACPGHFARLEVTDTGIGMDAATVQRVFEPFFSTNPERTGLGLSAAYGIVKQHGGWIDVRSAPGQGTTFWVYLPAVANPQG